MENNNIESTILVKIELGDKSQLLYKLNKLSNELNMTLDELIKTSILKLYNDVNFIRSIRN